MRRNRMILGLIAVFGSLLASSLAAQDTDHDQWSGNQQQFQENLRRPRGIYGKVDISDYITLQQNANPSITPADLNASFVDLYQDLLDDQAISGLTLQVHWDQANPNPPTGANAYEWRYIDDAFTLVAAWNDQHRTWAPKTIQFIVTPGFNSPQWVLQQIPSCDGLFEAPSQTPSITCGKATFAGYSETGDGDVLPLPWDPVYKSAWKAFLTALAARYGSNPEFVSISVAGPTATSAEMIMPNDGNTPNEDMFGNPPMMTPSITPDSMWRALFAFHYTDMPAYQSSDQAFIDEWDAAIDMYGEVFQGVTLVVTTGSGLPNFSQSFTIPSGFAADCANPNMDCAAETTILSHFVNPRVSWDNAKAIQTSGMTARSGAIGNNLGVDGVKLLSQSTARQILPSAQILGGEQFDLSFTLQVLEEGSTSPFPPDSSDTPAGCMIPPKCTVEGCIPVACIPQSCLAPGVTQSSLAVYKTFGNVPATDLIPPEQGLYNVLHVYFDGTRVASFFGGNQGAAPLNFLQAFYQDVKYAEANANELVQVVETDSVSVFVSAQDLLNQASKRLLEIAEPPPFPESGPHF